MDSEDDEVLKSACVKKNIGQWQVTYRDNDGTSVCLKVSELAVGRVWFLQTWLASPFSH